MTQNGRYKIDTEKRISTLEANFNYLVDSLDELKNNHLVHLDQKIDRLQWWIFITVIATAVSIIIKLIK